MGAWWQLETGSRLTPLNGKNTVPDELMLLVTDADHFVDEAQVEALSELEACGREDGPVRTGTTGLEVTMSLEVRRRLLNLEVDPVGWTSSRVLTLFPNGHCEFRPIWCFGHRLRADRVSVRRLGHAPTRPPGRNPSLVSGPNDEFATLGA